MDAHIELIGDRIIYIREEGTLIGAQLEATTQRRLAFVKEHIDGFYIVIYDLRQAQIAFMDLRLGRWVMEVDPNLFHALIISSQLVARMSVNLLSNVMRLNVGAVTTLEEAKAKAEALVAAETARRGSGTRA